MTETHFCADLKNFFAKEQLPLPKLPSPLAQSLQPVGPQLWQSQLGLPQPEDLPGWIRLARRSDKSLMQIGFAGRGINSWSMHLNLIIPGLAIFLQCRSGNAYDDAAASRSRIEGVMSFVDMLLERGEQAQALQVLAKGERLIASFADHMPSRWQWSGDGDEWSQDGDFTLLAALAALDDRIKAAQQARH